MKIQMRSYMNRQDFLFSRELLAKALYSSLSYSFIDSLVEEHLQPHAIQSSFDFSERTKNAALAGRNQEELLAEYNARTNCHCSSNALV